MKRLVFKKWVMVVIAIIDVLAFMLICSECDDLTTWLIVHSLAVAVFGTTTMLINKYGRKGWI